MTFGSQLPVMCTVCAVLPISLTKVKQLRTSTLGYVIATPTELPGVRTVCAVLPISLTKVKQLRASTLGYVIATPTEFPGGAYRLRRSAYIIDQGKTTPHLNLGLCNHNSITFPRRIAPRR